MMVVNASLCFDDDAGNDGLPSVAQQTEICPPCIPPAPSSQLPLDDVLNEVHELPGIPNQGLLGIVEIEGNTAPTSSSLVSTSAYHDDPTTAVTQNHTHRVSSSTSRVLTTTFMTSISTVTQHARRNTTMETSAAVSTRSPSSDISDPPHVDLPPSNDTLLSTSSHYNISSSNQIIAKPQTGGLNLSPTTTAVVINHPTTTAVASNDPTTTALAINDPTTLPPLSTTSHEVLTSTSLSSTSQDGVGLLNPTPTSIIQRSTTTSVQHSSTLISVIINATTRPG